MSVVKFKKEKQKQMKLISKIIYIVSKVVEVVMLITTIIMGLCTAITPFIINGIKIVEGKLKYHDIDLGFLENDTNTKVVVDFLEKYNGVKLAILVTSIFLLITISCVLVYITTRYLSKLFKNIHNESTPFTLENINYIKKIGRYSIAMVLFPIISAGLIEFIFKLRFAVEFGAADVLFVLIIYSISYIFEYGYEIQKDSKGVMYDEK